jgi:hypothetical protein
MSFREAVNSVDDDPWFVNREVDDLAGAVSLVDDAREGQRTAGLEAVTRSEYAVSARGAAGCESARPRP